MKRHTGFFSLLFLLLAASCGTNKTAHQMTESGTIKSLEEWLAQPTKERPALNEQDFSEKTLTKSEATQAAKLLWKDHQATLLSKYKKQWEDRELKQGELSMPFFYKIYGDRPSDGRSLFISMHGGGGTTQAVNDQQYENQKGLYHKTMEKLEGVYLAPRAPTNTWNLWHQNHIDDFFNIIIQIAVATEEVNPDKVYLLGYSAGGDGVFQLAPRMADRLAAASMMAGHPNETSPLGLKNLPFALHMGALDGAYDRNKKAEQWKVLLDSLEKLDPGTYIHQVKIHEGKGHWMGLQDAVALPWMTDYTRNPIPQKIVWKQDDRHHESFYWLGVPSDQIKTGGELKAEYSQKQNEINITANYSKNLNLHLNDQMLDLDKPITIKYQGKEIGQTQPKRTILNLKKTLETKGDKKLSFPVKITVVNNQSLQE